MTPASLPLNALRAFEASARHLNFTHAAEELCVTQGAVSHQIRMLEARLGVKLFSRLPRGLALTDEAVALLPGLTQSFARMGELIEQVRGGIARKPLTIGVLTTFAIGWLLPRLEDFQVEHPLIDVRVRTHNNKVNLFAEGLDCAIQFGEGDWPGAEATKIVSGELSPMCSPRIASQLHRPGDILRFPLFRSFRVDEWSRWFAEAGVEAPAIRGPVFDSSLGMVLAAERSFGIALAPASMFTLELDTRRVVCPFSITVDAGSYFLTRPKGRVPTEPLEAFIAWCARMAAPEASPL